MMRERIFEAGQRFGMMGSAWGIAIFLFRMLLCLAIVTLIVVLIIKAIRHRGHGFGCCSGSEKAGKLDDKGNNTGVSLRAIEILNERYAKGEIDDEEYQRRKAELLK